MLIVSDVIIVYSTINIGTFVAHVFQILKYINISPTPPLVCLERGGP